MLFMDETTIEQSILVEGLTTEVKPTEELTINLGGHERNFTSMKYY